MRSFIAIVAVASLTATAARVAQASYPQSVVSSPRAIEYFPDETTATTVVVHGAFSLLTKGGPPTGDPMCGSFPGPPYTYAEPACGYMYFKCPEGNEANCRMQWRELGDAIGEETCVAFGSADAVATATVRAEGTPLSAPDDYDLGIGTCRVLGIGKCFQLRAMTCGTEPPAKEGAPGSGKWIDRGGTKPEAGRAATDVIGAPLGGKPGAATPGPAGVGAAGASPPSSPQSPATSSGGGCSVVATPTYGTAGALGLVALGWVSRRLRRAFRRPTRPRR